MSYIDKQAIIDKDVVIYDNNTIIGKCIIKSGTVLYPNNIIIDSEIGHNCTVMSSTINSSKVSNNVTIGPNAHLRQNTLVQDNVRVGNFVEIKNSTIGCNTKIAHLTYIGDASVGRQCNIGCGVVFCNYDGKQKHKTTIGDRVFVGSNVNLVAPLTVEDDCFIAAGSTITKSITKDTFCIARSPQREKPRRK